MVGRESKRLPVGGFCFNETTLALVKSSLVQPAVDRGPVGLSACGFLTASLGSIHDASAADRSVTEKRRAGQRHTASLWPRRTYLLPEQR